MHGRAFNCSLASRAGFLALAGVDIPGEVYSWAIVFILPINSAINPILYTISTIKFKVVPVLFLFL